MKDYKVDQSNSTVEGDQVGRDKNVYLVQSEKSSLKVLSENISKLYIEDETYKGFIDQLQHYIDRKTSEHKGLEKKLVESGFEEDLGDALLLKERFFKRLSQNQFSDQVQNFFAHVLAHINTNFKMKILPLIKTGKEPNEVNLNIYNQIVEPLYNEIGVSSLDITMDDIRGMLYFLTGNCHIEWS